MQEVTHGTKRKAFALKTIILCVVWGFFLVCFFCFFFNPWLFLKSSVETQGFLLSFSVTFGSQKIKCFQTGRAVELERERSSATGTRLQGHWKMYLQGQSFSEDINTDRG